MWSSILKESLSKLEGRMVRRSILKFTPSGSLDLKLRVLLQVQCACFDLSHDQTSGDSIGIDAFNGSDRLHRTTFQPSLKCCLNFRFLLMTRLPVTQVDSTVLPVSFFEQTPLDSRAQVFKGRLALNPRLNLTLVSFSYVQKHFLG